MQQLIRTEWMKVRSYKAFWIILGLFVICVIALQYIVYTFFRNVDTNIGSSGRGVGHALLGNPFAFPEVWQTVSWLSGWVLFIPGLLVITLITNEFTFRTHRQNVIDGWTRAEFISAKIFWVVTFAVMVTVVAFLTALCFGWIKGEPFTTDNMQFIFYFFLESLSYLSIAMLFGLLIKRAGLAIALFFLYAFILKNVFSGLANRHNDLMIGNYFPQSVADTLVPFPFVKELAKQLLPSTPPIAALLSVTLAYLGLFVWAMYAKFKTDDL